MAKSNATPVETAVETPAETRAYCFVAVGPQVWGKSDTVDGALANMKQANGNRAVKQFIVSLVLGDASAYVDDMGYLCRAYASTCAVVMRKGLK